MRQRDLADMASRSFRLASAALPETQVREEQVEGWPGPEDNWRESFDETWTLDPSLQPAGEENLTTQQREKLLTIPEEVKLEVRKAHHQLGHPSRSSLLRMARAAGKSEPYLEYIRLWDCPACLRRQRPAAIPRASGREKPSEFGALVGVDLKEVLDCTGERHTFLNVLDVATRFSAFVRLENKSSAGAAQALVEHWVAWAGVPVKVLSDQGG